METFDQLFALRDPATILDIGASLVDGEAPIYQTLIDSGLARLIAIEPDKKALDKLVEKYPEPHKVLPLFLGNGREATFYETNWGPTGSLFEPNTDLLKDFLYLAEITEVVSTHTIETVRLDDVPEIDDVDFIRIDTQGAEKLIFENGSRVLSGTTLIQTEMTLVEMYKGMPLIGEMDQFLRSIGFQWHHVLGHGMRPFLPFLNPDHPHKAFNQQLWCDVVYVRRWTDFDSVSPDKLRRLAMLLHSIYGSYDLAQLALWSADRLTGTELALNYAQKMANGELSQQPLSSH